jgi:hypothetical protein
VTGSPVFDMQVLTTAIRAVAVQEHVGGIDVSSLAGSLFGTPEISEVLSPYLHLHGGRLDRAYQRRSLVKNLVTAMEGQHFLKVNEGRCRVTEYGRLWLLTHERTDVEKRVLRALHDNNPHPVAVITERSMLPSNRIAKALPVLYQVGLVGMMRSRTSTAVLWVQTTPFDAPAHGVRKIVVRRISQPAEAVQS